MSLLGKPRVVNTSADMFSPDEGVPSLNFIINNELIINDNKPLGSWVGIRTVSVLFLLPGWQSISF